jgi:hypothetical protein
VSSENGHDFEFKCPNLPSLAVNAYISYHAYIQTSNNENLMLLSTVAAVQHHPVYRQLIFFRPKKCARSPAKSASGNWTINIFHTYISMQPRLKRLRKDQHSLSKAVARVWKSALMPVSLSDMKLLNCWREWLVNLVSICLVQQVIELCPPADEPQTDWWSADVTTTTQIFVQFLTSFIYNYKLGHLFAQQTWMMTYGQNHVYLFG